MAVQSDQQDSALATGSSRLALCLAVTCPVPAMTAIFTTTATPAVAKGREGVAGHRGAPVDSDMNSNSQYLWV